MTGEPCAGPNETARGHGNCEAGRYDRVPSHRSACSIGLARTPDATPNQEAKPMQSATELVIGSALLVSWSVLLGSRYIAAALLMVGKT